MPQSTTVIRGLPLGLNTLGSWTRTKEKKSDKLVWGQNKGCLPCYGKNNLINAFHFITSSLCDRF